MSLSSEWMEKLEEGREGGGRRGTRNKRNSPVEKLKLLEPS